MSDKKKILLIEDETFIRELYVRILSEKGYQVVAAINGEEGWKMAKDGPDLILLDIMLPKLNGIELLKKLKDDINLKKIPVVLLTNLGQKEVIEEAFMIGASGYMIKMGTTPYEVAGQIKQFIDNPDYKMNYEKLVLD